MVSDPSLEEWVVEAAVTLGLLSQRSLSRPFLVHYRFKLGDFGGDQSERCAVE
jgi:hypothetical protein